MGTKLHDAAAALLELRQPLKSGGYYMPDSDRARDALNALAAAVESDAAPDALEALRPLAAIRIERATEDAAPWPDDHVLFVYDGAPITVGDVRAARAAISKATGGAS